MRLSAERLSDQFYCPQVALIARSLMATDFHLGEGPLIEWV